MLVLLLVDCYLPWPPPPSQHRDLQRDLEAEQGSITALSNMVVVVDDPASDAAYSQLEDELTALG